MYGWARVFAAVAWAIVVAPGPSVAAQVGVAAGARIASAGAGGAAPACAVCHGARGEGSASIPRLAGTGADYLREQLDAFASGTRSNPVMQPIAQALSPQQRGEVAAYYASMPGVANAGDTDPRSPSERGAWLATRGRWADELPACAQCHGPGGVGVGRFPPLAGQPADYIVAQLKSWQAGSRPAGPLGLMMTVARKLDEGDMRSVSDYYAGLRATAPAASAVSPKRRVP